MEESMEEWFGGDYDEEGHFMKKTDTMRKLDEMSVSMDETGK